MRFKLDENVAPGAVEILDRAGHDVATVIGQGLRGATDIAIAEACRAEQRVLVTLDKGFADIRRYPPSEYPGIVVCRLLTQNRDNVLAVIARLAPWVERYRLAGRLWIVDELEIRIRGEMD